jgi:hypothetical protein
MIKRWSTFNENTSNSKEIISSKFLEVREVFLDFEDMGIISYSMVSSDFERGGRAHHRSGYISFDPKVGDINRFLDLYINHINKFNTKTTIFFIDSWLVTAPNKPKSFALVDKFLIIHITSNIKFRFIKLLFLFH